MADEQDKPEEFRLHEAIIPWLDQKFQRMAKIAKEANCAPPYYTVVREEYKEILEKDSLVPDQVYHTGKFDKYLIITIHGEAPKIAGWKFVATLSPLESSTNLINKTPEVEEDIPAKYRTAAPWCDYCQKKRLREESFILKHDSGEYRQVGRNCLAKFLGFSNPEKIANYAEHLSNLSDEITEHDLEEEDKLSTGGGGRGDYHYPIEELLTMTAAVSRTQGWVSATTAKATDKRPSIREVVWQLSPEAHKESNRRLQIHPTEEDKKRATEAIAYVRSDEFKPDSDYKHNLKSAAAMDWIPVRAVGVVASLINFHERDKEYEIKRAQWKKESGERREKLADSQWLGSVGDKIEAEVIVTRAQQIEGNYGVTYLYKMQDGSGNVLTWLSSNDVMEQGKWYHLKGTVKKQDEYQGIKQTVVTRCKVEELAEQEEEEEAPESEESIAATVAESMQELGEIPESNERSTVYTVSGRGSKPKSNTPSLGATNG